MIMARTRRIETDEEPIPYVIPSEPPPPPPPRNVRRSPPTVMELAAAYTKAREDAAQSAVELSCAKTRDEQTKANVCAALEELQGALGRS